MSKNSSHFKGEALQAKETLNPEQLRELQDQVFALETLMFVVENNEDLAKTALNEKAKKD